MIEAALYPERTPLASEGWHEFNRVKWGIKPIHLHLRASREEMPALETVLYLNRRGQVCLPLHNPYLALEFTSTPTRAPHRRNAQWLEMTELLVAELQERGLHGALMLPPDVVDMRAFQWAGFRVGVRYTICLEFPYGMDQADGMVRNRIKKADAAGFRCERTERMEDVIACLGDTERRQGFHHELTADDLRLATKLMGERHVRAYVSYAPDGTPATGQVVLHRPGAHALGWLVGTRTEHLRSGATQQLIQFMLEDLQADGASGFDFIGANMKTVAASKMNWGGRITPYYTVESYGVRSLLKWLRDWMRAAKK